MEAIGIPIKDWGINIYYGIKTGLNDAFILTSEKRSEFIKKDPSAAEIIRPLIRGRDIKRYEITWQNLWLLNIHNGIQSKGIPPIDVNTFPIIKNHLDNFTYKLNRRLDRGITPYNLRSCDYLEDFMKPKIIWAELARTGNSFVYDVESYFCLAGAFIMTLENEDLLNYDYQYLVTILNHPTTLLYLEYVYSKLDDTGWQWKKEPVEKIPIPRICKQKQASLIKAHEKLQKTNAKNRIEVIAEIDKLIFNLYGFTKKEIDFTFKKLKVFQDEHKHFK